MNKPAPKEPSMDEILSSIRQIIADDDAGAAPPPRRPVAELTPIRPTPVAAPAAAAPAAATAPTPAPITAPISWDTMASAPDVEPDTLALSAEQIVAPEPMAFSEPVAPLNFDDFIIADKPDAAAIADFVDPDDIAFEPEALLAPEPEPAPVSTSAFDMAELLADEPVFSPQPAPIEPEPEPVEDVVTPTFAPRLDPSPAFNERSAFQRPATPSPARPPTTIAEAAPMPDALLSADIAEQLIEPATDAAVRHTFAKLNTLQIGTPGLTVEGMVREMLRPMLKDWLDENLPSMVERMVEKEIARISRGE